jgi:hypothetical protein
MLDQKDKFIPGCLYSLIILGHLGGLSAPYIPSSDKNIPVSFSSINSKNSIFLFVEKLIYANDSEFFQQTSRPSESKSILCRYTFLNLSTNQWIYSYHYGYNDYLFEENLLKNKNMIRIC